MNIISTIILFCQLTVQSNYPDFNKGQRVKMCVESYNNCLLSKNGFNEYYLGKCIEEKK